jgi:mannose-6-phosphate isomerase-like protein (cupin superfamily)
MPAITAAQNERNILLFRREVAGDGVHIAHVAARRGENSLGHHHTRTRDTFYVISGQLTVTLYLQPDQEPNLCFQTIGAQSHHTPSSNGTRQVHRVVVTPGDVLVVEPNVVHCAANLEEAICRFICIEGVGDYDFVQDDLRSA